MNEKVLKTLEFDKIINKLSEKAISVMGKELAKNLKPMFDIDEINEALDETTEATSLIFRKGSLPLGGLRDIRESLKRVSIGGILSIEQLLQIGDFLRVVKKAIAYSKYDNANDYFELVESYFMVLTTVPNIDKEISRCIISENEIADDSSRELGEIRRNIKNSNSQIKEQLNKIIQSADYKNMLQDTIITVRNGRYCVPIRQEFRNSFKGMTHDQSSTGATIFMEPISVVNLNNKIKELENKEKIEIEKILKYLSSQVGENLDIFEANLEILTKLDFIFAKGELSISLKASRPLFNKKRYINIKKGRHPLLIGNVVPIDIHIGKDFTTLLITGPNTGGKTVSLKTLGIFTLMGQAGLHISAFDNSELAIFDEVFADIGDEQSIEQSLSTFSSHMTNIVSILECVTPNSLVLLDELGAGTDPIEGAALAMAILQHLYKINVRVAVTTHYSELKVYALSTEGVENASCEFDIESLRPTYKLLIGIPGKSNAFAISKRLGLSDLIIDDARQFVSSEDTKFEDLITDLEINRRNVELEKQKAEQHREEAERLKNDFEKQKIKFEEKKQKVISDAKEEARLITLDAKEESDRLVRLLQKQIRDKSNFKELDQTRKSLKDRLDKISTDISELSPKSNKLKPVKGGIKLGDSVFVNSLGQYGTIESLPDQNEEIFVQVGIMKAKVNISDLSVDEFMPKKEKVATENKFTQSAKKGKSQFIKPELDIRGHNIEEGIAKLDKYLDDAYLSGISQVTIIHGKGTGVLRDAVQDYLRNHYYVKSYRLGAFGEGETGVTIVEFNE